MMFSDDDLVRVREMYKAGESPSQILRFFSVARPAASVPHLMELLRDALGLPYEAVQCVGGWWHDGTGELSDDQLDALLKPAIRVALGNR